MTKTTDSRKLLRQILALAMAFMALALPGCKSDKNADAEDLLSVVPSSATMVGVIVVRHIAEKAGCKIDGMEITPGEEMKKAIASISDPKTRNAVSMVFAGESGIEPQSIVFFTDSYNTYLMAMVADTGKFRQYVEKQSGEKFQKQGDVETCGSVALCGSRAWVNVSSGNTINAQAIANYAKLSRSNSFLGGEHADKLAHTPDDVSVWSDINTLASMRGMSVGDKATMRMVLATLFDDASFSTFSVNFEDGKIVTSGTVLNAKGKTAKYLLPSGKVDVKTMESLGDKADVLFAMDLSKDLVKKIEGLAASFGGGLPDAYMQVVRPVDGTVAFSMTAAADGRYGYNAVVTTDGKPTPELLNLAGSLGQVKNEGKYVRMSGGEAAQGGVMTVADMAKKLKGSALGVVLSGKMVSESPVKVNDADIKSMTLMLRPSDGGMEMVCDIEGNNPKENALITLLKMMAS